MDDRKQFGTLLLTSLLQDLVLVCSALGGLKGGSPYFDPLEVQRF